MKGSERAWPAQVAPDDFAERVVRAALAEQSERSAQVALISAGEASVDDEAARRRSGPRRVTRRAWAMVAVLALGAGIGAGYFGVERQREARVEHAAAAAASSYANWQREQEVEAQKQKLEKLNLEVTQLRVALEEQLKESDKTRLLKRVPLEQAAARPKAATSAESPRKACRCAPGDALCTCL